ncbi:MAG: glutamine amidotransferase [Treponema sp.]|nr:glutamine amidotransferase [Treponema sp.]
MMYNETMKTEEKFNGIKVFLYVLEGFADWEIAHAMAELNSRTYFTSDAPEVGIVKVGKTMQAVKTMGGFKIEPDMEVSELQNICMNCGLGKKDMLILPGSNRWLETDNSEIITCAKKFLDSGNFVAGICGATVAMANAGLLNECAHTSNDKSVLKMFCPGYKGENFYCESLCVSEKNLITASGIASVEFAREIIRCLGVFSEKTLEAWYNLYALKKSSCFYELLESMKK